MAEFTDEELLEMFDKEDTKHYAFNLLMTRYQQRVYWHVRRIVISHDDANDLTQDVFVKVWKSLATFRRDSQLFTWLYRIATNESLSFIKTKNRRFFLPLDNAVGELSKHLTTDQYFSGDRIQLKLQQAVLKLPPQQRIIFNMKYFEAMKYEEIAEVLKLSVGALKASYHHAVKKIEKYMLD